MTHSLEMVEVVTKGTVVVVEEEEEVQLLCEVNLRASRRQSLFDALLQQTARRIAAISPCAPVAISPSLHHSPVTNPTPHTNRNLQ